MSQSSSLPTDLSADDELDLFDALLIVVENIKLLVLGPLLLGLLAGLVTMSSPKAYESHFSIHIPFSDFTNASAEGLKATSSLFVERLRATSTLATAQSVLESQGHAAWAQGLNRSAVRASVERNSTVVRVVVQAKEAQAAQAMAQALLLTVQQGGHLPQQARAAMAQALEKEESSLANARLAEARLAAAMKQSAVLDPATVQSYSALFAAIAQTAERVEQQRLALQGLSSDALIQAPTLPGAPVKTKPMLTAVMAALAAGFVLLLFVFVRQGFRNAAAQPEAAAKLARIRLAFGRRRPGA